MLESAIKKHISYLPILTLILIGYGCIFYYGFYSVVNLEIFSYLTTTEIVLSFLPQILYITILTAATFTSIVSSHIIEEHINEKIAETKSKYYKLSLQIISPLIIFPIGGFCFIIPIMDNKILQLVTSIVFLTILYIYFTRAKKKINWSYKKLVYLLIFGAIITLYHAEKEAKRKLKEPFRNFELRTMDKIYSAKDSLIYFGRINNYTILYDIKESNTLVISNSKIKEEKQYNMKKSSQQ